MAQSREHINDLKTDSRAVQQDVARLTKQVAYQKLLIRGLWEFIKEKLELDDSDLLKMIEDIEKQPAGDEAARCPSCGRHLQDSSTACLYCGAVVGRTSLF